MNNTRKYDSLRAVLKGEVITPGEGAFEEARQIWNARLAQVPGAIVRCLGAADVAEAVNFARRHGTPISVKSGGHSYAGLGVLEGGLMIDLSRMNDIRIDKESRSGNAGAGARWKEFYEAAIAEGFAVTGGTVSSVGIAGFTLGGGSGWLSRKYGLALDNLLSAEVVTADGNVIHAGESENSDLFWGIRGGAGNFGIVTRFEFQLHEVSETVYGGQILYPLKDAVDILRAYREEMPETPDGFVCFPCAFRVPPIPAFPEMLHGQVVLALMMGYVGDLAEGESVVNRFRGLGETLLEETGPMPYMDLMRSFDAGAPSGWRWYTRAQYLKGLSDGAIETFSKFAADLQGALTLAYFEATNGKVGRVEKDATAFPHRDAAYSFHILAGWMDRVEDAAVMAWTRDFHKAMTAHATGGVYVNLLAEDEEERVPDAFGSNYRRLAELKAKWDPGNLFRCNQNIAPA